MSMDHDHMKQLLASAIVGEREIERVRRIDSLKVSLRAMCHSKEESGGLIIAAEQEARTTTQSVECLLRREIRRKEESARICMWIPKDVVPMRYGDDLRAFFFDTRGGTIGLYRAFTGDVSGSVRVAVLTPEQARSVAEDLLRRAAKVEDETSQK